MGSLEYEFKYWLTNEIYTKQFSYIQIYDCIKMFVHDGIIPFINKNGYNFCCNKEYICNIIATSLFYYTKNSSYLIRLHKSVNFSDEFYEHYTYKINREEWDNFWKYYTDLFNDLFFYKDGGFCVQLEDLIYALIDLNSSPTHIQYIQENIDTDSEDDSNKIDPYILDQKNRENHYKFTKFET